VADAEEVKELCGKLSNKLEASRGRLSRQFEELINKN
jgi:hypothetical protein